MLLGLLSVTPTEVVGDDDRSILEYNFRSIVDRLVKTAEHHIPPRETQPVECRLLSAENWLEEPEYCNITILDPDGWRGRGRSWFDLLSQAQFEDRLSESTVGTTV